MEQDQKGISSRSCEFVLFALFVEVRSLTS